MSTGARVRALAYLLLTVFFAVLFTFYTVRFTLGGFGVESLLLVTFSAVLWMQARRWYRRFRALRKDRPVNMGTRD